MTAPRKTKTPHKPSISNKTRSLADRMRAWRKAKGLTQSEAAERMGFELGAWENWEQSRVNPRYTAAVRLLEQLQRDGF